MVVPIKAPFILTRALLSLVATITTDFFNPSSPRSFSINSLTSLPLSPINVITFTSAFVLRAIIPIVTLLPTPLPANIPSLCPLPTVSKPSMALIPVCKGEFILILSNGLGGFLYIVV